MDVVLFCHPDFLSSQSMPRFAQMLTASYRQRGHHVEVWSPRPILFGRVPRGRFSKWAGYVDQYILFPIWVRKALKRAPWGTFFVFCDQALGPWVPLVKDRPHVVHVHDLLALRSALGKIPENPTSITGRIYQRYIRHGFRRGRHFISISHKTREDLHGFGQVAPVTSEVIYNGLNFPYAPLPFDDCARIFRDLGLTLPPSGMLLHVGGGQWYKNLLGVVAIYAEYASRVTDPLPLWCVSPEPNAAVRSILSRLPKAGSVRFLRNVQSATLQALYSQASAFLFPSLAEGFGWPLIEAQACGCPVITTAEPPMNEVAGDAALYLPRLQRTEDLGSWARRGAAVLQELLAESEPEKLQRREKGRAWVKRFDPDKAIDAYLAVYKRVLDSTESSHNVEARLKQSTQI